MGDMIENVLVGIFWLGFAFMQIRRMVKGDPQGKPRAKKQNRPHTPELSPEAKDILSALGMDVEPQEEAPPKVQKKAPSKRQPAPALPAQPIAASLRKEAPQQNPLISQDSLRDYIIHREVLGPPLSMRGSPLARAMSRDR